ncbi:MAG: DUF58 domain-containing protein [Chloroflexaceae bacterium]
MWFKNIFHRRSSRRSDPLFDENFLRRLERMSLQAQRTLRGRPAGGEHPSRRQLPTSIFSDHRPYTSGDDMRYIDWNAYARQGHVLVKVGETEQNIEVHLLLDASNSMGWGQPPKLRTAQQLAGALGYLSLAHNDRLRIVPFGATMTAPYGPAQGKMRMIEMMRYIETITLQQQTDLRSVLRQYSRYQRGGLMVICSDMLSAGGLEEGLRALPPPRWQVLVLHLLDPHELRPELQGPLELEDSETGQRLQITLDTEAITHYRRRVAAWQQHLAATCGRRGATYAQILTNWPLERKVVPYLRMRQLLM